MRNYIVTSFFLILPLFMYSQSNWEMGFIVGATSYQGDLSPDQLPDPASIDLMYGAFLRNYISPTFSWRANLWRGTWRGSDQNSDDINRRKRDFSFTNTITEGALLLEWDPFGKSRFREGAYNFRTRITPYFYFGVGLAHYQLDNSFPSIQDGIVPEKVAIDLADAEDNLRISVPAGLGLKFDLSKRTTLAFEGGPHYGFNDLVDGIATAGNPDARDWYWHASSNFTVRFGKKDSDGDGIPDREDACKFVPGSITSRGCPDRDMDGVEDDEDVCPDLAGLMEFSGCPDTDKDGIMDPVDNCPLLYGFEDTGGCPDQDNDCVIDSLDLCPTVEGLIALSGCPDTDGDGVADPDDPCPDDWGLAKYYGCPKLDSDCDGIIDELDACPTIPDTIGFTGCPDLDEDGVLDSLDLCPTVPGIDSNNGCPELAKEDKELLTDAQREVRFKTGSSRLVESSKEILEKVAELMERYPYYHLELRGYTDNVGRASSNLNLSERRAKSCFDYLIEQSIEEGRISYKGFGEADPIGNNKTYSGREMNRRVEFHLIIQE